MKGLLILWLSLLIFLSPIALSCLFQGTAACSLLWCLNLITNGDTLTGTVNAGAFGSMAMTGTRKA